MPASHGSHSHAVRLDEVYMHGLLWPFLLCATLLCGMTAALACLKYEQLTILKRSLNAPAVAEALIAICSGALLWIGWRDFLDEYLVPESWWSKLCMLLVGAVGAIATRSLYATADARPHPIHTAAEGTSIVDDEEGAMPQDLPALHKPFRPIRAQSALVSARALLRAEALRPRRTAAGARTVGGLRQRIARARAAAAQSRWCWLHPPKFSGTASPCVARNIFCAHDVVGVWTADACAPVAVQRLQARAHDGLRICKLGLVAIGVVGLYLTRSLYGDEESPWCSSNGYD